MKADVRSRRPMPRISNNFTIQVQNGIQPHQEVQQDHVAQQQAFTGPSTSNAQPQVFPGPSTAVGQMQAFQGSGAAAGQAQANVGQGSSVARQQNMQGAGDQDNLKIASSSLLETERWPVYRVARMGAEQCAMAVARSFHSDLSSGQSQSLISVLSSTVSELKLLKSSSTAGFCDHLVLQGAQKTFVTADYFNRNRRFFATMGMRDQTVCNLEQTVWSQADELERLRRNQRRPWGFFPPNFRDFKKNP